MDGVANQIITSVGSGVVLAVLGWLWLVFSNRGQSAWTTLGETKGLQSIAVIAVIALVLGLGALIALVVKTLAPPEATQITTFEGQMIYAAQQRDGSFNGSGGCPDDATVIGGYCYVEGDRSQGYLQNGGLGVFEKKFYFYCVWNGVKNPATFKATVTPVCARITKK